MGGDCQRPACCISTTEAPAAASDCAAPIRRLWPEIRPVIPAAAVGTLAAEPGQGPLGEGTDGHGPAVESGRTS